MKSEVSDYSIDDLARDKTASWTGVRNYQARNFMRDDMKPGDLALFYHSNAEPSGVAGLMEIIGDAKPDETQFEKKSIYYDPAASREKPRWFLRSVRFKSKFKNFVDLAKLRESAECQKMVILQKGSRLSITPLTEKEFQAVVAMGG